MFNIVCQNWIHDDNMIIESGVGKASAINFAIFVNYLWQMNFKMRRRRVARSTSKPLSVVFQIKLQTAVISPLREATISNVAEWSHV